MSQNDVVTVPLPGFSGEWELRNFGAVLKVKHGKSQRAVEAIDGPYPILASGGVIGRSSEALYSKPSVLIGRKGTIDKPRFMDTPFWTVDTLFYTEINFDSDPKFLYYKFCMVDWYRYNEASGVPSLNASVIERIEILVPAIAEQQAIALVLTHTDALIKALDKLIAKKRAIKQGAMQQLLTGKTQLPGFSGDWVERALGEICDVTSGKSKSPFISASGTYLVVDMGGVGQDGALIAKKKTALPEDILRVGDLVMPKDDIGGGNIIGKAAYIPTANRYVLGDHVYLLRTKTDDPRFLAAMINSQGVNLDLRSKVVGSAQLGLGRNSVLTQQVRIPEIKEQVAVARVLTDMDTEIDALVARREKTALIKIGMMQELLTGRTRLV